MKCISIGLGLFGAALVTGCMTVGTTAPGDTCGASRYQSLVGQPVSAAVERFLGNGARGSASIYGASQIAARTVPSDTLGSITYKNKFDVTPKATMIIVYDDRNGVRPYEGSDPKAKFVGAVENRITQIACGGR